MCESHRVRGGVGAVLGVYGTLSSSWSSQRLIRVLRFSLQVRSQSAPVRQSCGVALLQFLLDFPLGPARLRQHVAFLLANLEYEYESGRLQVGGVRRTAGAAYGRGLGRSSEWRGTGIGWKCWKLPFGL